MSHYWVNVVLVCGKYPMVPSMLIIIIVVSINLNPIMAEFYWCELFFGPSYDFWGSTIYLCCVKERIN